jgi:hypothetical protein
MKDWKGCRCNIRFCCVGQQPKSGDRWETKQEEKTTTKKICWSAPTLTIAEFLVREVGSLAVLVVQAQHRRVSDVAQLLAPVGVE